MARRSDEELSREYAHKQRQLAVRMARKADPAIQELEAGGEPLLKMLSNQDAAQALTPDEAELCLSACKRIEEAVARRVDAWIEKNNQTPRMF